MVSACLGLEDTYREGGVPRGVGGVPVIQKTSGVGSMVPTRDILEILKRFFLLCYTVIFAGMMGVCVCMVQGRDCPDRS